MIRLIFVNRAVALRRLAVRATIACQTARGSHVRIAPEADLAVVAGATATSEANDWPREGNARRNGRDIVAFPDLSSRGPDLCLCRPSWCFRLYRRNGHARHGSAYNEDDRADPEHAGRRDRHIPILAAWAPVLANSLSVCDFRVSLVSHRWRDPTSHRRLLPVVGIILLLSAAQMFRSAGKHNESRCLSRAPAVHSPLTGAVIGFISGTTGTGGGVFLAPVILAMNWATAR